MSRVVGSNPTGGMAGLRSLVEPLLVVDLIHCIICQSKNKHTLSSFFLIMAVF